MSDLKCARGHWWTDANTILRKQARGGIYRECRTCKQQRERAYRQRNREAITPMQLAGRDQAKAKGLPDTDPRHGTLNGYSYWGCRCTECRAANATATRVLKLKKRAKALGVLPRERNEVKNVRSLDGYADQRYGMDRVLVGSVWDDPTADLALYGQPLLAVM